MLAFFSRFTAGNAMPYYEKLKKLSPDSTYVPGVTGVLLELKGQIAAALKKYEEACELDARNWYAHFFALTSTLGGNEDIVRWAPNI